MATCVIPEASQSIHHCKPNKKLFSKVELERELVTVAQEGHDFAGSICPRIMAPSPIEFLREYVMPNRPCIVTDIVTQWPAYTKWTDEYLRECLKDNLISVNVTPNGRGDAVLNNAYFVMPEDRQMTFSEFLNALQASRKACAKDSNEAGDNFKPDQPDTADVFYLSHQNDNLRTQLHGLKDDVSLPFAEGAFGTSPDAINLWMGDSRAVTTLHKDHYENMYGVLRGEKRFTLFPPTSLPLLYPGEYTPRVYRKRDGVWHVEAEPAASGGGSGGAESGCGSGQSGDGGGDDGGGGGHPWISVNPEAPDLERFPMYAHARAMTVRVRPGELLYLPAMWYHQVAQADDTLAVNYWFDMIYDARYVFVGLLGRLTRRLLSESAQPDHDDSDEGLTPSPAATPAPGPVVAPADAAGAADERAGK